MRLRLLTFNIAHGRGLSPYQGFRSEKKLNKNLERLAHTLLVANADIVALQEIDQDSHWTQNLDFLEMLRERCGYSHAEYGIHKRRTGKKQLAYGNGILSRFPIVESHTHIFRTRRVGQKGFMHVKIDIGQKNLSVINLHLDHLSKKERLHQAEALLHYVEKARSEAQSPEEANPIICGDFNCSVRRPSDALEYLLSEFGKDIPYHFRPLRARTYPAPFPQRSIDYILLPEFFEPLGCKVLRSLASDHRPVLVEMRTPSH